MLFLFLLRLCNKYIVSQCDLIFPNFTLLTIILVYIPQSDDLFHNLTLYLRLWLGISQFHFAYHSLSCLSYLSSWLCLIWLHLTRWLYIVLIISQTMTLYLKYRHRNSLTVANDFHSIDKCYGSQWLPSTIWSPAFFRISFFVRNRRDNSYRFGTTWGWVKDDRFNFWVNYAFIISQFDFVSHSLMLSHILTWYRAIFISKSHNVL